MTEFDGQVARVVDSAFENLANDLDRIAAASGMKSDEMMRAVRAAGDFGGYYGDWIRESWEDWEPIDTSEVES